MARVTTKDRKVSLDGMNYDAKATSAKMPMDTTNEIRPLDDYAEIPCNKIIPFQNKKGKDFKPHSKFLFNRMVESIKDMGEVMEAITVRLLPDNRFELLAGEQRFNATMAAGQTHIRARILRNISNEEAMDYFTLTNIMRRDMSVKDKAYALWMWFNSGENKETIKDRLDKLLEGPEHISIRQIERYIKLNDLIPDLFNRLDDTENPLSLIAAYQLAFIPHEYQEDIIATIADHTITEKVAQRLRDLSESGNWSKDKIIETVFTPKHSSKPPSFSRKINTLAKTKLKPEALNRADEIFEKALMMYLEKHPEDMKEVKEK